MAKLNQILILSMTRDLNDINEITCEMLKHVKNGEVLSWRFPNELAQDITIEMIKDVTDSSTKYILLLELIIDRLYFILNLAVNILESSPILNLQKNVYRSNAISFGVLVSMFWKRIQALSKYDLNEFMCKDCATSTCALTVSGSQTDFQSFVTCGSCNTAMDLMRELIAQIQNCVEKLNLPSKISEKRDSIERDIQKLTQFGAMRQWARAITADVRTLTKFSKNCSLENISLAENCKSMQIEKDANLTKLQNLEKLYVNLQQQNKEGETKITQLNKLNCELESKYKTSVTDITLSQELREGKEEELRNLESKLTRIIHEHEKEISELKTAYTEQLDKVRIDKNYWVEQEKETKKCLDELQEKFNREQESQSKLEIELRNEFNRRNAELEQEKTNIERANLSLTEKFASLEYQFQQCKDDFEGKCNILEKEKSQLETKLKECKERELALVQCPDLNGPILRDTASSAHREPLTDMMEQLDANEIRVKVLQEQNCTLRRTINKMMALTSSRSSSRETLSLNKELQK